MGWYDGEPGKKDQLDPKSLTGDMLCSLRFLGSFKSGLPLSNPSVVDLPSNFSVAEGMGFFFAF